MKIAPFLSGLTVILLLFGCAAVPAPANPKREVLPTVSPLAQDVLATFHKSGGVADVDETLTVYHGGVMELVSRAGTTKSLKVNEPILLPLRDMLEQKEFGALEPVYQAPGADLFVYTITARDLNGTTKSVTTMDGVKNPEYLGLLIGMLEQLRTLVSKNG